MMFDLEKELLIICNNEVKEKILRKAFDEKRLFSYTFLSMNSLKEKLFFKITTEAYLYAAIFLKCSYANSKIITPSIYYVDVNEVYEDSKLIQLQTLKKELIVNDLLEFDKLFEALLTRKKVYIYQEEFDNFTLNMIEKIKQLTDVSFFTFDDHFAFDEVCEFDDFYQEIEYVFTEIRKLLDQGIDINNIFIANTDYSYEHILNRYSILFNIPITYKEQSLIVADREVKKFIQSLEDDNIFELLADVKNITIKNKLISLINEYYHYGLAVLVDEIKSTTFETESFVNAVKIVDINYGFAESDYVFVVNFTNGSLPKIYLDNDYLGDKYKNVLPITTTDEKNKKARNKAISSLQVIKNKVITYPLRKNEEVSPSSLIRILKLKVLKPNVSHFYSTNLGRINYGIKMDNYLNYGRYDNELKDLNLVLGSEYQAYDNQFRWLDKDLLHRKLNGKIRLSYSSVSEYFKCGFYFYLDRVLKIPYEDDKRAADLGTAYHEILEKYHTSAFDLEALRTEKEANFKTISEKFYFEKFWEDFLMILRFIDSISEYTMLNQEKHENEVKLDFSDDYWQKEFIGYIDKIMFTNIDGIDYIAIVDYKTGTSQSSSLDNICYGINLQLPIYMYLVYRSKLFENPHILGSYLHYVFNEPEKYKDGISIEEQKWDALKMVGYSIDDINNLKLLDYAYNNSKIIKGLKTTKDNNFSQYAKVLSHDNFKQIVSIVDELIKEAFIAIENGNFKINPKEIDNKDVSCQYCHYKDICYKRYENKVALKSKSIESILGGE